MRRRDGSGLAGWIFIRHWAIFMIIGVDEAGRGCIIGPMVICAAAINPLDEYKMKEMGVKDSKKLSPAQREKLYPKVAHM